MTVLGIVFGGWPPERFGRRKTLFAIAAVLFCASSVRSAEDILIADFEGDTYGDWTVTGEAFGPGPDKGTVEGKLKVVGFRGKGFANSCWNDFLGRGTLTSPKFKIQRASTSGFSSVAAAGSSAAAAMTAGPLSISWLMGRLSTVCTQPVSAARRPIDGKASKPCCRCDGMYPI